VVGTRAAETFWGLAAALIRAGGKWTELEAIRGSEHCLLCRTEADCLTAVYTQQLPLELCR